MADGRGMRYSYLLFDWRKHLLYLVHYIPIDCGAFLLFRPLAKDPVQTQTVVGISTTIDMVGSRGGNEWLCLLIHS